MGGRSFTANREILAVPPDIPNVMGFRQLRILRCRFGRVFPLGRRSLRRRFLGHLDRELLSGGIGQNSVIGCQGAFARVSLQRAGHDFIQGEGSRTRRRFLQRCAGRKQQYKNGYRQKNSIEISHDGSIIPEFYLDNYCPINFTIPVRNRRLKRLAVDLIAFIDLRAHPFGQGRCTRVIIRSQRHVHPFIAGRPQTIDHLREQHDGHAAAPIFR